MADNEAFDSSNFATKPLLFGKWNYEELNISDKTLEIYISVHTSKQKVFVPHTAGRYQLKRFRKASMPLVERLMGTVAYHGRNTGKKLKAMRIVKQALDIIHHHTGVNPLQVSLYIWASSFGQIENFSYHQFVLYHRMDRLKQFYELGFYNKISRLRYKLIYISLKKAQKWILFYIQKISRHDKLLYDLIAILLTY